jgi:hypothetical protein
MAFSLPRKGILHKFQSEVTNYPNLPTAQVEKEFNGFKRGFKKARQFLFFLTAATFMGLQSCQTSFKEQYSTISNRID